MADKAVTVTVTAQDIEDILNDGLDDRCPDCQVSPGEEHHGECDVARCLLTGMQRLICRVTEVFMGPTHPGQRCGRDIWTGEWPGVMECREFGWYVYMSPRAGWLPCAPDYPGATEDLNRLHAEAVWCRVRQRFVKRGEQSGG